MSRNIVIDIISDLTGRKSVFFNYTYLKLRVLTLMYCKKDKLNFKTTSFKPNDVEFNQY